VALHRRDAFHQIAENISLCHVGSPLLAVPTSLFRGLRRQFYCNRIPQHLLLFRR
jgi:hypothetical protein